MYKKENIGEVIKNQNYTTCSNFECLEKNKNKRIVVKGVLRTYTPNKTGKGAGHMFGIGKYYWITK